jgi:N-acetylneuraminic acid mutarotase
MPTARIEVAGVALDKKIYIIGGEVDKTATNLVEVYDTVENVWYKSPPLPMNLDHLAAASFENKIYVVGGFDEGGHPSNRLFIYDPIRDVWGEATNMPTARGALTAEFIDGILYAVGGDTNIAADQGGYDPAGQSNINEAYNPETDSWVTKTPMPLARHHHVSAVADGKLYIIGGRYGLSPSDQSFLNTGANEVYDPAKDTWVSLESMLTNSSGASAAYVNGGIYVFGGETKNRPVEESHTYNINEKYEPETNKWVSESHMSYPRHGLAAVDIGSEIFVIGGGKDPGFSTSDINEVFDSNCQR